MQAGTHQAEARDAKAAVRAALAKGGRLPLDLIRQLETRKSLSVASVRDAIWDLIDGGLVDLFPDHKLSLVSSRNTAHPNRRPRRVSARHSG